MQSYREERERKNVNKDLPLAGSFLNTCNSWGWAILKPGGNKSILVFHMGVQSKCPRHHLLPSYMSRKLDETLTTAGTLIWDEGIPSWTFHVTLYWSSYHTERLSLSVYYKMYHYDFSIPNVVEILLTQSL